ncbi:hypothetical protein EV426DRAFT_627513 [Tirmania nivea]|nr:hypothetical protein EV426DRAFT_627513 [Tirmania nivea]
MVIPQYKRPTQLTSLDFTTIFLIQHGEHPVFFLEINAAGHIYRSLSRAAADKQMRERVDDLRDDVRIPILYGTSALGTMLCFYKYTKDTRQLERKLIPGDSKFVIDTAPRDRWNFDLLTAEGEQSLGKSRDYVKLLAHVADYGA